MAHSHMQYYRPEDERYFVGDCMPFFHDGVFHLYYGRDEEHHALLGGLGAHERAHLSSPDLIQWTEHPLAIPLTETWEGSVCTGSTFFHDGTFYGFYAVRKPDWTQQLGLATSKDGIHFQKLTDLPFAAPPQGYHPLHYRDPFVFQNKETGLFHMLITAWDQTYPLPNLGGCVAQLVSDDLWNWQVQDPFLIPGLPGAPECPDYFEWNGWYYLIFSNGLRARYRMSRRPLGPWERPPVDVLDGPWSSVMKTAPFHNNRRIGVAWLGTRVDDKDTGKRQWGGNAVFRELVQHEDGTLGVKFPPELIPPAEPALQRPLEPVAGDVSSQGNRLHLANAAGLAVAAMTDVPPNIRITLTAIPAPHVRSFGLRLREEGIFERGYELRLTPLEKRIDLFDASLFAIADLDRPVRLDIVVMDDILDVSVNEQHCLINRCPELKGSRIEFFGQNGAITFDSIQVRPLSGKKT